MNAISPTPGGDETSTTASPVDDPVVLAGSPSRYPLILPESANRSRYGVRLHPTSANLDRTFTLRIPQRPVDVLETWACLATMSVAHAVHVNYD